MALLAHVRQVDPVVQVVLAVQRVPDDQLAQAVRERPQQLNYESSIAFAKSNLSARLR